jgi:hypothetical protein
MIQISIDGAPHDVAPGDRLVEVINRAGLHHGRAGRKLLAPRRSTAFSAITNSTARCATTTMAQSTTSPNCSPWNTSVTLSGEAAPCRQQQSVLPLRSQSVHSVPPLRAGLSGSASQRDAVHPLGRSASSHLNSRGLRSGIPPRDAQFHSVDEVLCRHRAGTAATASADG